jgi:hypothetical protein
MKKELAKLHKKDEIVRGSLLSLELCENYPPSNVLNLAGEISGEYHHIIGSNKECEYIILKDDTPWEYILFAAGYIENKTPALKSYIVNKFLAIGGSKEDAYGRLLPALGENKSEKNLLMHIKTGSLDKKLLIFLHEKNMSLKNCMIFTYPSDEDKKCFLRIIDKYNLSASRLRITAEYALDISKRDGLDFNEILKKCEKNNGDDFFNELYSLRYPGVSGVIKDYEKKAAKLSLPPSVKLIHDAYFENNRLSLEISFKSTHELFDVFERLGSKREIFEEIENYMKNI